MFFFAPEKGVFTYFLLPLLWVPRHSLFASLDVAILKPLRYTCIIVPAPGEYYCTSFCLSPHRTLSFEVLYVCSVYQQKGELLLTSSALLSYDSGTGWPPWIWSFSLFCSRSVSFLCSKLLLFLWSASLKVFQHWRIFIAFLFHLILPCQVGQST